MEWVAGSSWNDRPDGRGIHMSFRVKREIFVGEIIEPKISPCGRNDRKGSNDRRIIEMAEKMVELSPKWPKLYKMIEMTENELGHSPLKYNPVAYAGFYFGIINI